MAPSVLKQGKSVYKTERLGMHALRNAFLYSGNVAWFYGVTLIALADVATLQFTSPLFTALIAAVFLGERIGGHRMVVEALLDSFQWVPPGAAAPSADSLTMLADLLRHSFDLAIRAAAPVAFSVLMSTLLIGLLSKALPQVGTLGFGLGINFAVVLVMTVASLGGVAWLMELHLATGLDRIVTEISKANLTELVE